MNTPILVGTHDMWATKIRESVLIDDTATALQVARGIIGRFDDRNIIDPRELISENGLSMLAVAAKRTIDQELVAACLFIVKRVWGHSLDEYIACGAWLGRSKFNLSSHLVQKWSRLDEQVRRAWDESQFTQLVLTPVVLKSSTLQPSLLISCLNSETWWQNSDQSEGCLKLEEVLGTESRETRTKVWAYLAGFSPHLTVRSFAYAKLQTWALNFGFIQEAELML